MREMTPELPFGEGRAPSGLPQGKPRRASGPGVSKARYRWQRGWGQRLRRVGLVYVPIGLVILGCWRIAAEDRWREAIEARIGESIDAMMASPELAIRRIDVTGASPDIVAEVEVRLSDLIGSSSMRLEVTELRGQIEALGPVRRADVQLGPDGVLAVQLVERHPVTLWRDGDGVLYILDGEGVRIVEAGPRARYPHMVLLLGDDAPDHVAEAIRIVSAAPALRPRIRALVRVGQRRWDIVLDRDQRIQLPEEGAVEAVARVIALHQGEDELLDRDLTIIDMRIADRPVLRMPDRAVEERQRQKLKDSGEGEET